MSSPKTSIREAPPSTETGSIDQDELKLQLHRSWALIENFAASFCSMNFIGATRSFLFIGLLAGGPVAVWSTYIISIVFLTVTAAVLAEVCSALPLSGSIYIWAAESAGPKYARLWGFIVAWWSCTAWTTFVASNCQNTANFVLSQLIVWEIDIPGGIDATSIKWRSILWIVSEAILVLSVAINYLPPRLYAAIFRFSMALMLVDFLLCIIWFPIGASKTYGLRTAHEAFLVGFNGTGAPPAWNFLLSFLFTSGAMVGFDASGHIAEETKHASVAAARGLLYSAVASGILGFLATILFLFCVPDLETLFGLAAPQPFVLMYAMALGKGPSVFMTILAVIGLILNTSIAIVAASRLIFAVARDGVLPWSQLTANLAAAVTVIFIIAAALLCTILPSQVAFTSLVSAGGVPTIAAYALIPLLRLFATPNALSTRIIILALGARYFIWLLPVFNLFLFAIVISPFVYPTDAQTFNFACVIFGAITVFGVLSWWFIPEDKWLRREIILKGLEDH
ncbi:gamma-aminobutyric acid transporter [Flagelloscypha sp. PMI_526]|nr:gamma-aminobutyric acid transporter [Flagelloscypha sp. PMI_526]